MTEQQIRESYIQLYNAAKSDKKKRGELELLGSEAEKAGLKDWGRLIEARMAAVDEKYDLAIDLSSSLLSCDELSSELRAWNLLNRGYAYIHSVPLRTDEAISDCTEVIGMSEVPSEQKAKAFINRGFAYSQLEPPRTADEISDYTTVIEMSGVLAEQKAKSLYNRGIAYGQLEPPRTEEAIADYTTAIEMSEVSAEQKAKALYNRGNAYSRLEPPRTDDALADYTAVIEMSEVSAEQKAKALVNRGAAYDRLEPPRTAGEIADYTKVIDMSEVTAEQKAKAYYNRGLNYKKSGRAKEARDDFLESKKESEKIGDTSFIKSIDFMLSLLDVPKDELSREDKAMLSAESSVGPSDGAVSIEEKIIREIRDKRTTVFDDYNEQPPFTYIKESEEGNEAILAILKGWGSAVPLVLGGDGACRGGGYFLKFNGKGVGVDPGHDYLKNFHDQKFHLRELNAVLVSHNHPDHTNDLKSIDDVKYEIAKRSKKGPAPYLLVMDNDTADSTKDWTGEEMSFRTGPIRADARRHDDIIDLSTQADLPFQVNHFKVKHDSDVPDAVGYRVSFMKEDSSVLSVGFSCDTEYFDDLCEEDKLGGCDILVAHMSQPTIEELKDPNGAAFKERHLGYRGTMELIKKCKPKLTIVSEFWAGLDDARILLLQGLRKRCKTGNILPGGVGLLIKVRCEPMGFEVRCTNCKKWTSHDKIKVGSSSVLFGPLSYLCRDCCL